MTQRWAFTLRGTPNPAARVHRLMSALNRSHGVFYSEPNSIFSGGSCVEFALLRRAPSKCDEHMHARDTRMIGLAESRPPTASLPLRDG